MLKHIRNLNPGYKLLAFALVAAASGATMLSGKQGGSWLCADEWCRYVQGYSVLLMAAVLLVVGMRKLLRPVRRRR